MKMKASCLAATMVALISLPALVSAQAARGGVEAIPPSPLRDSQPTASMTLAELERLALDGHPTLRAADAAVEAARQRARQAGAWRNPVIGFSGEEITPQVLDRRGEYGFFVEQPIVLGGKLRLGRALFDREVEEATVRVELQRQRIVATVRTIYYQMLVAQRRIEVLERLALLGHDAVGVTAQLFNVGAADRPDYLESEIETRRIELDLLAARNGQDALSQQLAAAVGRPDVIGRVITGRLDVALPELEREPTLAALVERSPHVRAARAAAARAQAVTSLSRRETFPDLVLRGGAAYNRERGEDTRQPIGWEGAIEAGVDLPIFNRNRGGIAAARSGEAVAQAEVERVMLVLRAEGAAEFATYLTSLRATETYRDELLPRAEQAYQLYLARYREMGAAYPQVLVSQRTLFELTRQYLQHLEQAWRSALRLQGLLAGDALDTPSASYGGMNAVWAR